MSPLSRVTYSRKAADFCSLHRLRRADPNKICLRHCCGPASSPFTSAAMVQMRTVLRVADNSGAKTVRCINILRRRRQRPSGNVGSELIVSVTANDRSVTTKKARKGEIHRALVIRSKNEPLRRDGGFVRTGETAAVLLTSDGTAPMGTRIRGPVSAALDRKRFLKVLSLSRVSLFSTVAGCSTGLASPSLEGRKQGIWRRYD